VHLTTCFIRKPRAHSLGHAPALWRTNIVAEWHVTVCLAVNAPPAKNTTPTRHPPNDTFRNGKPSILHRVNVRVNVCYSKVILILNNGNIHPNIHPTSNASFSIRKRIISRKACQICAWGAQLPYTARRANTPYSAAASGRRGAGACPGERACAAHAKRKMKASDGGA